MKKIFYLNFYFIAACSFINSAAADVDIGIQSFIDEDYVTAHAELTESANEGDSKAQYWLGLMHESGEGVRQDYFEARKWYERAAVQGEVGAQLQLGELYLLGRGTEKDRIRAYMWFDIAARQGVGFAGRNRDRISQGMHRGDITQARKLAREWRPENSDTVDDAAYARARAAIANRSRLWWVERLFSRDGHF